MITEAIESVKKLFSDQQKVKVDLRKRTMSSFNLSIGTGLAFESLFEPTHDRYDKERKIPNKVKIGDYTVFAVNLLTIAKNVLDSCSQLSNDYLEILKNKDFEAIVCEEISIIEGLLFGENIKLYVYLPDHEYLSSSFNKGKIDTFTKLAAKNLQLYKTVSKMKFEDLPVKLIRGSRFYKLAFKSSDKILMFSTFNYDLLNNYNIQLLESHTGVLIKKEEFNKKYKKLNEKPYNMLPYDEMLLYLLGDNTTSMLCTKGEKVRKLIYNLATSKGWTPKTSILTVITELRKEKELTEAMRNFSRLY